MLPGKPNWEKKTKQLGFWNINITSVKVTANNLNSTWVFSSGGPSIRGAGALSAPPLYPCVRPPNLHRGAPDAWIPMGWFFCFLFFFWSAWLEPEAQLCDNREWIFPIVTLIHISANQEATCHPIAIKNIRSDWPPGEGRRRHRGSLPQSREKPPVRWGKCGAPTTD